MRATHQQFTTALEGLTRQNTELQNELKQSRQQAANELAALRGAPLRGTQATGVGVDSDFSGSQDAWRDWSTVFKGYAGAAIPRLQKLKDDAAKAAAPIPNATIMDENDRAASTQLYWMMLMICKGRSAQHLVLGRRQRRSRSLATTDREVRAEDENTVRRASDGHPLLLFPR